MNKWRSLAVAVAVSVGTAGCFGVGTSTSYLGPDNAAEHPENPQEISPTTGGAGQFGGISTANSSPTTLYPTPTTRPTTPATAVPFHPKTTS